ncbi:mechanosensitive ion channel family protein [Salinibacterium sp. dk2585]|uniref:mechanosensitive ion channel family protein n=1 Tax=unclassified Salinibacterium TaxID=2632331 RepID=UPI0011C246DC|nr:MULTISPECIES: mechanosensitive ion channel family protein [unclassified Salinibacterium]QEE60444.1 mechanosensitive ion channel family protein [Salinibacterium sp. dk2585]TXK55517.1 mechanosensitive ion channel family protein [Salinibacterium sp. dk5596]
MIEWNSWVGTLLAVGIALVANVIVAVVVRIIVSRSDEQSRWLRALVVRLHPRIQLLVALIAFWNAAALTAPAQYEWWDALSHVFLIATVLAGAWLLSGLTSFGIERLMGRYSTEGESLPEVRRMRTQLQVIRRLVNVLIAVIAIGVVLFSFPEVRAVGTSVLASAGIVSIIAGLAAQTTLGNLIAGIQLAFSDSVRVGDVVVVEGEWGTIGEITLSYVVVNVWDERRLILPCTYFASQPYENWTRQNPKIMGTVYMDVDWRVPIKAVRERFQELLASTELWDGRAGSVLVTGSQGGFVTIRFLVSAKDSGDQWSLMCLVREEMVTWLQEVHPEALPATRVVMPEAKSA